MSKGDFFSLHMPLTPGTKKMFNDDAFAKIKKVGGRGGRRIGPGTQGALFPPAFSRLRHRANPRGVKHHARSTHTPRRRNPVSVFVLPRTRRALA
jgi:hypothetical protein